MSDEQVAQRDAVRGPQRAVVILLDSLCRHLLGAYGSREFATPHLDRFAAGALRFERHYAGSLPCMPARHDLLVGSLDFLWRPWGSIEVWEEPLTASLRDAATLYRKVRVVGAIAMPQTFNVGARSLFVTVTAWIAIVLSALVSASAVVQNAFVASVAPFASGSANLPALPLLTNLLLGYLPWVVGTGLLMSLLMLASAIGLLLRLEWARRAFIGSARRSPGKVLRVSRMADCVPVTAST